MGVLITIVFSFLRLIVSLSDVISFPFWWIYYCPWKTLKKSSRIKAGRSTTMEILYRSADSDVLTTSPFPECSTLDDLFLRSARNFSPNLCLGTRELLREENETQPNGKVFKKVIMGDYKWLNYEEVNTRLNHLGSGLQALNQKPRTNILIFAETRAEWMISAQACFKYNFPLVTLYATLGEEAIVHGINEAEVTHIITSCSLLPKFKKVLDRIPRVRHIIYMINEGQERADTTGFPSQVQVHSMSSVEQLGSRPENATAGISKPSRDDLAVIMYTSGSTGLPKGVLITHGNLMAAVSGMCPRIPRLSLGDTYIAYLPLAHVLELAAEIGCLGNGVKIGFSTPLTLTDQSSKIKKGSQGDATVLRPTLLAAVPSIMDRIYKNVWDKVNSSSPFGKELFSFAYDYKKKWISCGYDTPLINRLLFRTIRQLLGGRVRMILSGGAPLSVETQRFMNVCLCCPVSQGYGLTETCGAGTIHEVSDLSTGRVGAPLMCNEIMLRNWEEGNYLTTDTPYPRGEILIGGANVTLGYLKNPEKTKEDFCVINGQRWFFTGDIGQFHDDGCLEVIDRRKDLVKLQAGEYVSLNKVETALKTSPVIDNICVYADSMKMFTVGLVVPNAKRLKELAHKFNLDEHNIELLCRDGQVIAEVLSAIKKQASEGGLERFEIPQKVVLCADVWTADMGLVTESMKLKRKNIQDRYQDDINQLYA